MKQFIFKLFFTTKHARQQAEGIGRVEALSVNNRGRGIAVT
jgi:hypothetical protein